jgi:aldehyde:ferredoxin oxidoreductase
MAGFEGRMLNINLSNGTTTKDGIDRDTLRKFIGGSGLAAKLIFDRVSPDVDPLSPDNVLFLVTGPLSGTGLPGGARFAVCAKSPLTNMFGESSCGGDFASEMRSAGYDGITISGASDEPAYILIQDDKVEIKPAADLWGKNNFEVTNLLKERHGGGKPKVLTIGVGGEKLVRYAAVCNGKRDFAARCGMGALMGSKKLKAIVVTGGGKVPLASPDRFAERRKLITQKAKDNVQIQVLGMMGTSAGVEYGIASGDMPGQNWKIAGNQAAAKIGGDVLNSPAWLSGTESCRGCMVGCKRVVDIKEGPFKGAAIPGPEYEGLGSLGSLLMIDDLAAVIRMNEMCNDYGIDVISCGSTMAMAMDCLEHGILTTEDLDGIELRWGNHDAAMKMITRIAKREGFGDVLAEGSKRAAEKIGKGAAEYAVEVKGLEVPMHDPRANHGLGLSYATGARGACQTNDPAYSLSTGIFDWPELGLTAALVAQLKQSQGWGIPAKNGQDLGQIVNAAILCYMLVAVINAEDLTDLMVTSSGFDYTFPELVECGERIWHMKRGVSNLMGVTAKDDRLPKQILTPPAEGGAAGSKVDLELMLKEFYPARGLNPDGRPSKEKLLSLGLPELVGELYQK